MKINQIPQVHTAAGQHLKKQRHILSPCLHYPNSSQVQHAAMPAPGELPYSSPKPLWPCTHQSMKCTWDLSPTLRLTGVGWPVPVLLHPLTLQNEGDVVKKSCLTQCCLLQGNEMTS